VPRMENLHLIVGLGNPGAEYAQTRHNAGFTLVEKLASRWNAGWTNERKFKARVARAERNGVRVLLCQAQTFMNLSGEAVGALKNFTSSSHNRSCWWQWTMRICRWARFACGRAVAVVAITDWSPSSSIWARMILRGCGSALAGRKARGKSRIMCSDGLTRVRPR